MKNNINTESSVNSKKIIESIAEYLNINISTLSSQLGYKRPQTLYDIQKGKTRNISSTLFKKISRKYPELNIDWLLTGKGEMLKEETETIKKTIGYSKTQQLQKTDNNKKVPYYDIDVTSTIVKSFSDVVETPSFFVDYKPFNDCSAYVNNFGDSMYPKYKNGEKLAVKQIFNLDVITWGETFLVVTNENANDLRTIKDVHYHENESKIILRASNPAFKGDTVINKEDVISMFAVKGKISQNFI